MFRIFLVISFAVIFVQAHLSTNEPDDAYLYRTDSSGNTFNADSIAVVNQDHDLFHNFISKISDHLSDHIQNKFKDSFNHVQNICKDVIDNSSNSTVMSESMQKGFSKLIGSPAIKKGLFNALSKFVLH